MKKRIIAIVALLCLIVGSIAGFNIYQDYKKQKIYDSLLVEFKDEIKIEYGDKIDVSTLIDNYTGEITLPAIDTTKVGRQEIVFKVSQDDVEREYQFEIEIVDTKKPVITLKQENVEIEVDDSLDISKYIKSVKDDVDGDIVYKEKVNDEEVDYYTYNDNINYKAAGTYKVEIIAVDKNGNKTIKTLNVVVKEGEVIEEKTETEVAQTLITPNNKVIVIDAGHQAKGNSSKEAIGPGSSTKKAKVTSGATGISSGKAESQINLEVSLKLRDELKSRGYTVVMTRTSQNVNISNQQRAQIGNKNKAGAVIHIHCDSLNDSSVNGAHTIAISKNNPYIPGIYSSSSKLARNVIDSYCNVTGIRNRGVAYRDDLTGLNWSQVPSIYIELGFISNSNEDKNLTNSSFQKKCAKGIADGIDNYFK